MDGSKRAVLAVLGVGLLALAGGIVATLSDAAPRRAGTNDVSTRGLLETATGRHAICQGEERIPAGTATLRMPFLPGSDPRTAIAVTLSGSRGVVARGSDVRWDANVALVPLHPQLARDLSGRVCVHLATPAGGQVGLLGSAADGTLAATNDGHALPGRVRFEYLRPGSESWWAFASTVVHRVGLGHAWSGSSVALLAALLTLTSIALAAWQLVRTSR